MGAIGGLLGMNGGASGTGFSTNAGTNGSQLSSAYGMSQNGIAEQQQLLAALQQQNGLGNQSQVYNQLQGVANGTGPNPAQAQLAQATGANVANQAALMAGQRGAAQNVGLMARQAAQQGANTQQQAAGQAATMQANQSLNAINAAGNMANTQAANQVGQTNALEASTQGEQGLLQGVNTSNNQVQGSLAGTSMGNQAGLIGGVLNGVGGIAGLARGGMVQNFDNGGAVQSGSAFPSQSMFSQALQQQQPSGQIQMGNGQGAQALQKGAGKFIGNLMPKKQADPNANLQQSQQQFNQMLEPGQNPNSGSNGSNLFDSAQSSGTMVAAKGGNVGDKLKGGGHVPGEAKVKGNSYANDTVKALLSPGEVVIPRSVMQSKDPIKGAANFVQAVMAKKGKRA